MSPEEIFQRLKTFDEQYLPFPPFVAAKNAIEANLGLYRETGIAKHMLISGEPGTGKSTLCKWLKTRHPQIKLADRDQTPLLSIAIPPSATVQGVIDEMLKGLGDPYTARGTVTAKTSRVVTLCKNCRVEFMLLDEAQHLYDRGQATTQYKVADWLKSLIDTIGVPVTLIGLPNVEHLLQVNDQLRRRFSTGLRLAIGQSDVHSIETECLQLFLSLASLVDIPVSSRPYTALEMGQRLYRSSDGRVSYIKKLLFTAMQTALEQDIDEIDAQMLEDAFVKEIWPNGRGKLNPFNHAFEFRRLDRGGEPFQASHLASRRVVA